MTSHTKGKDISLALATCDGPVNENFSAFVSSGKSLLPIASTAQKSAILKSVAKSDTPLPPARAQRIIESLYRILASNEFIKELSDTIGQPHLNETEDEFVIRCKASMRAILERKLTPL